MPVDTPYFYEMYADSNDPWGFADRWYDHRKYQLTVAALPRRHYRRGYEPACSIGVLSELLAARCDQLLCADLVPAAVAAARSRLAQHPHVTVEQQSIPADWPAGPFDLVVLSEVLYYLTETDLTQTLARVRETLEPGGDLVAVHWRHPVAEHRRGGDQVHAIVAATPGLAAVGGYRDEDFRLDVYRRTDTRPESVAHSEGLVSG